MITASFHYVESMQVRDWGTYASVTLRDRDGNEVTFYPKSSPAVMLAAAAEVADALGCTLAIEDRKTDRARLLGEAAVAGAVAAFDAEATA